MLNGADYGYSCSYPKRYASFFFATYTNGPILIFAAGSAGNVAPFATIGGRLTGLYLPEGIAIGPAGP